MATSSISRVPAKTPRRTAEEVRYIAAVLSGIYAATGQAILSAENHHYALALKNAKKVALDQVEEIMRGKA